MSVIPAPAPALSSDDTWDLPLSELRRRRFHFPIHRPSGSHDPSSLRRRDLLSSSQWAGDVTEVQGEGDVTIRVLTPSKRKMVQESDEAMEDRGVRLASRRKLGDVCRECLVGELVELRVGPGHDSLFHERDVRIPWMGETLHFQRPFGDDFKCFCQQQFRTASILRDHVASGTCLNLRTWAGEKDQGMAIGQIMRSVVGGLFRDGWGFNGPSGTPTALPPAKRRKEEEVEVVHDLDAEDETGKKGEGEDERKKGDAEAKVDGEARKDGESKKEGGFKKKVGEEDRFAFLECMRRILKGIPVEAAAESFSDAIRLEILCFDRYKNDQAAYVQIRDEVVNRMYEQRGR
ncbi:hypothetical protein HK101_001799 [Irineochytrium annulatum]|nr:hypothetical protein HK101_001799 [Irineochytrium annulatum]